MLIIQVSNVQDIQFQAFLKNIRSNSSIIIYSIGYSDFLATIAQQLRDALI